MSIQNIELQKTILKLQNEISELKNKPKRSNALKEAQIRYYNKNKENICEKNKIYNKSYGIKKFNCICGSVMPHHSKYKHFVSKKHLEFLEKKNKEQDEIDKLNHLETIKEEKTPIKNKFEKPNPYKNI
tara:strand:+ start:916 stop:1302 length:387 start_codon:yes stop_codon:yes gene_type:complete